MNTLTIFLYVAGVIGSFAGTLTFIGILVGAIYIAKVIAVTINNDSYSSVDMKYPSIAPYAFGAIFLFIISSLIPPEKTVYYMAASEMSEVVIESNEVREVFKDLGAIIKAEAKGAAENIKMVSKEDVKEVAKEVVDAVAE